MKDKDKPVPVHVAIIGAGCAGMSAHIWLCELHLRHTLFEGNKMGGMLHRVHNTIENYPPKYYANGAELADELSTYVHKTIDKKTEGLDFFVEEYVQKIEAVEHGFRLHLSKSKGQFFTHVLLASGTRYRQLDIPGYLDSSDFISQSATYTAPSVVGEKVLVVGGGDAAFEGSRILWEHDCKVVVSSRNAYRARPEFVSQLTKLERVKLLKIGVNPIAFHPGEESIQVKFSDGTQEIFKKIFVRIGVVPVLPALFAPLEKDDRGYIRTDANCETSIPGIFAVGDVSVAPLQSIATAIGDGARAAKAIQVITHKGRDK